MKTLSIVEMASFEYGRKMSSPCALDLVQLAASLGGLVIGLSCIGTGPIGWAAMASILGTMGWSGVAGASSFIDCL